MAFQGAPNVTPNAYTAGTFAAPVAFPPPPSQGPSPMFYQLVTNPDGTQQLQPVSIPGGGAPFPFVMMPAYSPAPGGHVPVPMYGAQQMVASPAHLTSQPAPLPLPNNPAFVPMPMPGGFLASNMRNMDIAPPGDLSAVAKRAGSGADAGRRRLIIPPPAPGDIEPGPRQLIVNYIAVDMTSAELRALFDPFGEVEIARVVDEPDAGHNRGFGFVYMRHHADAANAIANLTGRVLRGKRLRVSYAIPQRPIRSVLGPQTGSGALGHQSMTPDYPAAISFSTAGESPIPHSMAP
jgi:hypothetical protein